MHAGGDRRGHRRRALAGTREPAVHRHDDDRWRHGVPLRDAGIHPEPPLAEWAPDRLGPELVRRLPDLHLLFHRPRPARRRGELCHPLRHRLQARHDPGLVAAADRRLGVRSPVPPALARPGRARRSNVAVPVRLHVHHRRREPVLDAGRGVRVLVGHSLRPVVPRPVQPGPADREGPWVGGGGPRVVRPHPHRRGLPGPRRRGGVDRARTLTPVDP